MTKLHTNNIRLGQNVEQLKYSYIVGVSVKGYNPFENCVAASNKIKHHLLYGLAVPLLGIYPRSVNIYVNTKSYTKLSTTTLFIISPN